MMALQIISVFFSVSILFFTYIHYKRKDFSTKEMLMWTLVWVSFIGVSIFPQLISPYAQKFGFARLMDFIAIMAFVVLFIILFHNYLMVHRLEKRIEILIRKLALKDMEE